MADTQKVLATFEYRGIKFEVLELVGDDELCISTVYNSIFRPEIHLEFPDYEDEEREHDGKVIVFPHGAPVEIL